MRVGYILTTFPSRTETFAAREMESLGASDLDITVFAATGDRNLPSPAEGWSVFYRPGRFSANAFVSIAYLISKYPTAPAKLLRLWLKLMRECPREAISLMGNIHTIATFARYFDAGEISHVHAYFLSWPAIVGLALSIVTDRPFSISAHARDIFVEHGAMESKVARAGFVTVCTNQGLKYLQANMPVKYHNRLHLNYHGVKKELVSRRGIRKGVGEYKYSNTVIAVGRLIKKKGFEDLLKAFALIAKRRSDCGLVIVGEGPEREKIEELIGQLAIGNHVELLGWENTNKTLLLIQRATILVAPSLLAYDGDRDGIPNVILEAFANGTPVIASRLDAICEAVEHRKNCLLVKPGAIEELASAIDELLNNKILQKKLAQEARETVLERFDLEKNARRLTSLFVSA
jgi:glycosyltransferase involved in cell wall biosynthesis